MNRLLTLAITIAGTITASSASAAALEQAAEGAIRDTGSGWIFPKTVAGFKGLGVKPIEGTNDKVANYELGNDDNRIVATVYIYPSSSPALDGTFNGAKKAIESGVAANPLAQIFSEGPFLVGNERPLRGRKVFYKLGLGPQSVATLLYYVDVGEWIVKVRITGPENREAFVKGDAFVRALPWNSLINAGPSCTGYSCTAKQTEPVHGLIPEMLAQMLAQKSNANVGDSVEPCSAASIATAYAATPPRQAAGSPPFDIVARCREGNTALAFARFVLPDEIMAKLSTTPDGLTLSGPFSFVISKNGQRNAYSDLHDGPIDTTVAAAMLGRVRRGTQIDFATSDKSDAKLSPVIRFVGAQR